MLASRGSHQPISDFGDILPPVSPHFFGFSLSGQSESIELRSASPIQRLYTCEKEYAVILCFIKPFYALKVGVESKNSK